MSRRRYLSTDISTDTKVNQLARDYGDFAALLYTWLIPHAGEDGIVRGTAEEILYMVLPGRRDKTEADVDAALQAMQDVELLEWRPEERAAIFPSGSFYRYQSNVKSENRRADPLPYKHQRETARNSEERRATLESAEEQRQEAENSASVSISSSISSSPSSSPSSSARDVVSADGELFIPPSQYGIADDLDEQGRLYRALEPFSEHDNNQAAERRLFELARDVVAGKVAEGKVTASNAPELAKEWHIVRRPQISTPTGRVTSLRHYLDGWRPTEQANGSPPKYRDVPVTQADVDYMKKRGLLDESVTLEQYLAGA